MFHITNKSYLTIQHTWFWKIYFRPKLTEKNNSKNVWRIFHEIKTVIHLLFISSKAHTYTCTHNFETLTVSDVIIDTACSNYTLKLSRFKIINDKIFRIVQSRCNAWDYKKKKNRKIAWVPTYYIFFILLFMFFLSLLLITLGGYTFLHFFPHYLYSIKKNR